MFSEHQYRNRHVLYNKGVANAKINTAIQNNVGNIIGLKLALHEALTRKSMKVIVIVFTFYKKKL